MQAIKIFMFRDLQSSGIRPEAGNKKGQTRPRFGKKLVIHVDSRIKKKNV